jgi:hypothetical protein
MAGGGAASKVHLAFAKRISLSRRLKYGKSLLPKQVFKVADGPRLAAILTGTRTSVVIRKVHFYRGPLAFSVPAFNSDLGCLFRRRKRIGRVAAKHQKCQRVDRTCPDRDVDRIDNGRSRRARRISRDTDGRGFGDARSDEGLRDRQEHAARETKHRGSPDPYSEGFERNHGAMGYFL